MSDTKDLAEIQRKLEDLQRKAEVEGDNSVPMDEVFTKDFLCIHSRFSSFEELIMACGYTVEDFNNIPEVEWNKFIKQNTSFDSWDDMLGAASQAWIAKKLGLE